MKIDFKNILNGIAYFFGVCLICSICALGVYKIGYYLNKQEKSTPVEEKIKVDSIIKENNNTKIIIEHLNNEKNEEVIKIYSLNNDSTLDLFYKLVKE